MSERDREEDWDSVDPISRKGWDSLRRRRRIDSSGCRWVRGTRESLGEVRGVKPWEACRTSTGIRLTIGNSTAMIVSHRATFREFGK